MTHDHETPDDWSAEIKALFSRVYRHMEANQDLFSHPLAAPVPPEHWQTTAWNAAWFAACCVDGDDPWVHIDDAGHEIGAEVPPGAMS